ncbi:isocitrate lyase/PEP mutase family protein [Thalassotalea mangrovi]|uniref:Isocitrate lyase/PEP mutase family protein n=1 Tax=Thalassotalea mangrovi TaxID=2572245 RepID=A0A4U1B7U8_9GAMM|nr:isocitrate lyase/PEP mutase family protein [Thalassotalea mangrovi]TKB46062.1 isocitrate lyase/PEP mutase family protein [Thalassotalea mangrovi]
MKHNTRLKQALARDSVLKAPGVANGLSLRLIEQAGFEVGFVSGAGIAFCQYGVPDVGLISMTEMAQQIRTLREISALPLIVDMDTGFGNAINVQRTVKLFEQSGASAMQMEDQVMPKRCGHMLGKQVISSGEMVGKIKAFTDARNSSDTLLIARTDALAINGFDDAMQRARQYLEAGADLLFIEAPTNLKQMQIIADEFKDKVPLVHNLVEGGNSPVDSSQQLQQLGYKIALYPVALLHAFVPQAQQLLRHIATKGETTSYTNELIDLNTMNKLVKVEQYLNIT